MKKLIIAIDGHSSCGKSSLAKELAKRMNYTYIDSGAMYRAITYFFIKNDIDINDKDEISQALSKIKIEFKNVNGVVNTFLNGENIEEQIRSIEVANYVSKIAEIPEIRKNLVAQQQAMGKEKGIIMDGRDIGTVVFPNAELKIFLTASQDVRTQRRLAEMKAKNIQITYEDVRDNLLKRDKIDSERSDSPLKQAQDAILIDNSALSIDDVADLIEKKVEKFAK